MSRNMREIQTSEVFSSLWGDDSVYSYADNGTDINRVVSFTDGKLQDWMSRVFYKTEVTVLDAGCGLGYGFINIMDVLLAKEGVVTKSIQYHGLDLIDLEKTAAFLNGWYTSLKPHVSAISTLDINTIQTSMLTPPLHLREYCDFVLASGSLHHTPSVKQSLVSTLNCLKPGGYYLGWIVNGLKPLRYVTDGFFRDYFAKFQHIDECAEELNSLVAVWAKLKEALGDAEIEVGKDIGFLGIEAGTHKIQTLLYDHIFKCYAVEGESQRRHIHQLFDGFRPSYYHQTTRAELESILYELGVDTIDIVSKVNGHFFFLQKRAG